LDRPCPAGRLAAGERLWLMVVAAGLLALLAVAAWVRPDESGQGTHQQLGLPPCTFRTLTGRPCPSCGMTTSWAHLVRGEAADALRANVAGSLLGLAAMAAAPWLLLCSAAGRWVGWTPGSTPLAVAAVALGGVMVLDWVRRLLAG